MSIDSPIIEDENDKVINNKRGVQDATSFYVEDTYVMQLSDKPSIYKTEVTHLSEEEKSTNQIKFNQHLEHKFDNITRVQRSNDRGRNNGINEQRTQIKRPWECEAKIKWLDLGYDYYPRYLRTVECTRHSCFYGHFTCKPRSFTVKILRRRRGECAPTKHSQYTVGIDGLHGDLKELWVWEERAVNFCCDCSLR